MSAVLQVNSAADVDLAIVARYFRILGDPTRLGILELLADRRLNVTDLCAQLGASQSNVSNHLACLRWCELVRSTRIGREQIYELTDQNVTLLVQAVTEVMHPELLDKLRSCRRLT